MIDEISASEQSHWSVDGRVYLFRAIGPPTARAELNPSVRRGSDGGRTLP